MCALQHLPFFALSNKFFKGIYSTFYQATMVFDNALTKALISIQHYTFLPMMLVARFGERSLLCTPDEEPCPVPMCAAGCSLGRPLILVRAGPCVLSDIMQVCNEGPELWVRAARQGILAELA